MGKIRLAFPLRIAYLRHYASDSSLFWGIGPEPKLDSKTFSMRVVALRIVRKSKGVQNVLPVQKAPGKWKY